MPKKKVPPCKICTDKKPMPPGSVERWAHPDAKEYRWQQITDEHKKLLENTTFFRCPHCGAEFEVKNKYV